MLDLRSHIKLRDNRSSCKYRQIFGIEYISGTRSQQDTQLNSEIKTTNIKFGKRTGLRRDRVQVWGTGLGGFNDLRPQVTRGKKGADEGGVAVCCGQQWAVTS